MVRQLRIVTAQVRDVFLGTYRFVTYSEPNPRIFRFKPDPHHPYTPTPLHPYTPTPLNPVLSARTPTLACDPLPKVLLLLTHSHLLIPSETEPQREHLLSQHEPSLSKPGPHLPPTPARCAPCPPVSHPSCEKGGLALPTRRPGQKGFKAWLHRKPKHTPDPATKV
jgi:hypothetical protein